VVFYFENTIVLKPFKVCWLHHAPPVFNILQLYGTPLSALYLCVLYLSQNNQ